MAAAVACSSSSGSPAAETDASTTDTGVTETPDTGTGTPDSGSTPPPDTGSPADALAACASPGMATAGAADMHCVADDGGAIVQPTSDSSCCNPSAGTLPAACNVDAGGGDSGCDYGATMYGMSGSDDDCKYSVSWTSSPICEGTGGVEFTVTAKKLTDNSPVTGGGMFMMEAFTTTPGDASAADYCDNGSLHPSPTDSARMTETTPGSGVYMVNMQFDMPGAWTIRFHFHHNCADVLDDSPHGHAAFHLTVP